MIWDKVEEEIINLVMMASRLLDEDDVNEEKMISSNPRAEEDEESPSGLKVESH